MKATTFFKESSLDIEEGIKKAAQSAFALKPNDASPPIPIPELTIATPKAARSQPTFNPPKLRY